MGRIVFSIVSLIALAIIIVMNAGSLASFNLFGWTFEEVPLIAIVIVSFVLGALHSFVFYISSYFARRRREKISVQKQALKSQKQTIRTKDSSLKEAEATAERAVQPALPQGGAHVASPAGGSGAAATGGTPKGSGGWLRNLFGKNTASGR